MEAKETYGYGRKYKDIIKSQEKELINQEKTLLAKDMFEQRGYEQYWDDADIVAYKRKHFISDTEKIIIYKRTRNFEGLIESDSPFTPNEPLTITFEELQAINQQMKEIGVGK